MTQAFQYSAAQLSTPEQAAQHEARLDRLLDPDMLKALAEPTRSRLLSCLIKCARPCSVTEVAACCSTDFSMVARHLSTMAKAGLLVSQKRGRTVWYSADSRALAARFREIADAIDELEPQAQNEAACCDSGCCADTTDPDTTDPDTTEDNG